MGADPTILLGAVAYDPKVVSIWEGIREHFRAQGAPMDFALFSNYERQVEALLAGHVDVAWNTPLAHVRVRRRTHGTSLSLGMRDSDRDFRAKIVVRKDAGIAGLADLAGKRLAVGSRDSTQARILPLHFLRREGVDLGVWRAVEPRCLVIPLDAHVQAIARRIGLTRYRSPGWAMALDVTKRLRRLDPLDPVKYDFALFQLGLGRKDAEIRSLA